MASSCFKCSTRLDEGCFICPNCGTMVGQSPAAANVAVPAAKPGFKMFSDLNSIGGWLILVAFGLVVSRFACLSTISTEYPLLTRGEHQPVLGEHVSFATLITLEIAINAVFIAGLLCLNFLFFTKKKIFPKWMIVYLLARSEEHTSEL